MDVSHAFDWVVGVGAIVLGFVVLVSVLKHLQEEC
jgi:hypothetical protein